MSDWRASYQLGNNPESGMSQHDGENGDGSVTPPELSGGSFQNFLAQRDLAIACHDYLGVAAHAEYCC